MQARRSGAAYKSAVPRTPGVTYGPPLMSRTRSNDNFGSMCARFALRNNVALMFIFSSTMAVLSAPPVVCVTQVALVASGFPFRSQLSAT